MPIKYQGRFGKYLQDRRQTLGMSLTEVAAKLEMTPEHLGMVEKDHHRKFDIVYLPRIAQILQCDIVALTRLYLRERAPELHRRLFTYHPEFGEDTIEYPEDVQLLHRLYSLPKSMRLSVVDLINQSYTSQSQNRQQRA